MCYFDNWMNGLTLIHSDASVALGNVACDSANQAVANKLVQTAAGTFVSADYLNCKRRRMYSSQFIYSYLQLFTVIYTVIILIEWR